MITSKAKWITADKNLQAPLFKKDIFLEKFEDVNISISGLGFFELYINKNKVSEDLLTPVWSNYENRDFKDKFILYPNNDTMSSRIYYLNYNITDYLNKGKNEILILLGNGWYRQNKRNIEGDFPYSDELKLIFDISVKDEIVYNIISDTSVQYIESFITENNIYYGEIHNYSKLNENFEFLENADWKNSVLAKVPDSRLFEQNCPSDAIIDKLTPTIIYKDKNRTVYDLKQNISGRVVVQTISDNSEISINHAENINDNFTLNYDSCGGNGQIQNCTYRNVKKGSKLYPRFTWQAFRYFEIIGECESVYCEVIHSKLLKLSDFKCDNDNLNWLYETYLRTQTNNMHCGVPSDCPHRERLGYTGDGQITCEASMLNFDGYEFYKKWIADIADSQDINTGHVQHTAPFYGGGGGPGGWGSAIVFVPYYHYKLYKDKSILTKYFPNMLSWLKSMQSFSNNGLIIKEIEGGWCLGEWCTPDEIKIPEAYINTYFYIKCMKIIEEISLILNKKVDYSKEINISINAIINNFYNKDKNEFCNFIQGSNIFAIDLGLANDELIYKTFKYYDELNCFDTGLFGTPLLIDVLCKYNRQDIAFKLLNSEKFPSYSYMKNHNATTFWEYWSGFQSHDHPMFGSVAKNLFYDLLGIKIIKAGFEEIEISPYIPKYINYCYGKLKTVNGVIEIEIKKNTDKIHLSINIDNINCKLNYKDINAIIPKNKSYQITIKD